MTPANKEIELAMSDFNNGYARPLPQSADMSVDTGLRSFMLGVYNKLALGLVVSGALAWVVGNVAAVQQLFYVAGPAGEWRDYSVGGFEDCAVFAVFRRSGDAPLYTLEKRPELQRRQGQWALIGQGGQILKRGHELEPVLRFFDRKRFSVVE